MNKLIFFIEFVIFCILISACNYSDSSKTESKNKTDSIYYIEKTKRDSLYYIIENSGDGYWQRGVYFSSKIQNEKLFQVRVNANKDIAWFYFIGAIFPEDSCKKTIYAYIYELDENYSLYTIDSIPILPFEKDKLYNDDEFIKDFALRQFDNLILEDNKLYYYKETEAEPQGRTPIELREPKEYFKYILGSKQKSCLLQDSLPSSLNMRVTILSYNRSIFSPKLDLLAYTNTYDIFIKHITNWESEFDSLLKSNDLLGLGYDTTRGDFNMLKYFPNYDATEPCPDEALIGNMCWHPSGRTLYFDNSGICYACIWMIDIENRKVTKIVPEHEAINPYYFMFNNRELLAYVRENNIMLCESDE